MKRVKIKSGYVGLVFQNEEYKRVLEAGSHWVKPWEVIKKYDMTAAFNSPIRFNLLMKNQELIDRLHLIEVKDHEIVLKHEDGLYKGVLTPGRYAFWKGVVDYQFTRIDLSKYVITESVDETILKMPSLINAYLRIYVVDTFEKGVLFVDGRFVRELETGTYRFWKSPQMITIKKTDLRKQQLEIAGQEILTKDKANLRINFSTDFQVQDVVKALVENKEFERQLYIQLQLSLREFVGTLTLDELLERKENASEVILQSVQAKASQLGVKVLSCGIRDIILPGEVREIMNQVLIAQKKAQANIITRREETASTRSLLNTAKLMEENTMLFKLKEMEYVEKIADKINSISLSNGNQVVDQLKDIFSR